MQDIALHCVKLLQATSDALSGWSHLGRAVQAQQLAASVQQPGLLLDQVAAQPFAAELWLLASADSLLQCMRDYQLSRAVGERQLLETLGELLRRVRSVLSPCTPTRAHVATLSDPLFCCPGLPCRSNLAVALW